MDTALKELQDNAMMLESMKQKLQASMATKTPAKTKKHQSIHYVTPAKGFAMEDGHAFVTNSVLRVVRV
jgi:hypothetical protein